MDACCRMRKRDTNGGSCHHDQLYSLDAVSPILACAHISTSHSQISDICIERTEKKITTEYNVDLAVRRTVFTAKGYVVSFQPKLNRMHMAWHGIAWHGQGDQTRPNPKWMPFHTQTKLYSNFFFFFLTFYVRIIQIFFFFFCFCCFLCVVVVIGRVCSGETRESYHTH